MTLRDITYLLIGILLGMAIEMMVLGIDPLHPGDQMKNNQELFEEVAAGKSNQKCGECLMEHVDIVPLRSNGTCPCCEVNHQCEQNSSWKEMAN